MKLKMRKDLKDKEDLMMAEILMYLDGFFNGDYEKMKLWVTSKNLHLGGISPLNLILAGRTDKVLLFVKSQIEENKQ